MKRTTLIYALVLLLALMAVITMAQGRRANQPAGSFVTCQKALGLSKDQVAKMTRIRTAFMNNTATLRADLQAKMKKIAGLWAASSPDLREIKRVAAEADRTRAEIRDKAIDARGAILKVLTPSQRATCMKRCQSGQCCCGMCTGLGMGMGMGMGCGNATGTCPMGMGKGRGGAGMGMDRGRGMRSGCPMNQR